jgi:hypothetical protein
VEEFGNKLVKTCCDSTDGCSGWARVGVGVCQMVGQCTFNVGFLFSGSGADILVGGEYYQFWVIDEPFQTALLAIE